MVGVHIRFRPLSKEELEEGHKIHEYDLEDSDSPSPQVTLVLQQKRFPGFASVLSSSTNNHSTYESAVEPLIPSVLQGNTVCCFCYGHTNSGKTHTIIGYGLESGMYKHAAKELFEAIKDDQEKNQLMIQVRFAELYNGRVYDLLDGRKECHVREDAENNIHIRSATQIGQQGQILVQSLFAKYGKDFDEIVEIVSGALKVRATGTSELHDQSSRSHAVLELEIVTPRLAECRQQVVIRESEVVPVGKQRDTVYIQLQTKCYEKDIENGTYRHNPDGASPEEYAALEQCEKDLAVVQKILDDAQESVKNALADSPPCVGGKFVFVDLAGAEFTGEGKFRTPKEKNEAKEINTSLLALKECIRAQHRQSNHIPFRNSKLTMVLKPYLDSKDSSTVMIANVSSSLAHISKSVNTIQYAALVSGATANA